MAAVSACGRLVGAEGVVGSGSGTGKGGSEGRGLRDAPAGAALRAVSVVATAPFVLRWPGSPRGCGPLPRDLTLPRVAAGPRRFGGPVAGVERGLGGAAEPGGAMLGLDRTGAAGGLGAVVVWVSSPLAVRLPSGVLRVLRGGGAALPRSTGSSGLVVPACGER